MTVYVIQCELTGNVKIGYTRKEARFRLQQLKTATSSPLKLVREYKGLPIQIEKKLHKHFSTHHVTNEWFKKEVLTTIDSVVDALNVKESKVNPNNVINTEGSFIRFVAPQFRTINPYIIKVWDNTAKKYNMDVEELFYLRAKKSGYPILSEAYDIDNLESSNDFTHLEEYNRYACKALKSAIDDENKEECLAIYKQLRETMESLKRIKHLLF